MATPKQWIFESKMLTSSGNNLSQSREFVTPSGLKDTPTRISCSRKENNFRIFWVVSYANRSTSQLQSSKNGNQFLKSVKDKKSPPLNCACIVHTPCVKLHIIRINIVDSLILKSGIHDSHASIFLYAL